MTALVSVAEDFVGAEAVVSALEREEAENEVGREIVGVAEAWSCARETGNEDALGVADESEEKVSFSLVSDRFAIGLSTVDQQTLTWFLVCVHSSLYSLACSYAHGFAATKRQGLSHAYSPRFQTAESIVST